MSLKKPSLLLIAVMLPSCATEFKGNAHLDRSACESKCHGWGMDLYGMVAMGEYSDACVCKKPSSQTALGSKCSEDASFLSSAASAAGGTGVVMQHRRQQAAASAAATTTLNSSH